MSAIQKLMSKIWGIRPTKNRGPKTTFCRRFRNLTAYLSAYIFGKKHDIDSRARALATVRSLLHRLKISQTLVCKWLKIGPEFFLRKFCILFHCQDEDSHTEVSKRNSNFDKRKEANGADASRIRWRRIVNVGLNETMKIRLLVSRGPKKFEVSSGIASDGLKWQYIVNCHIF